MDDLSAGQKLPEWALLGFDTSDDAAVWRMGDGLLGVATVDFLTPIVDDPYDFGRIAAANALSDVFAMGARPMVALNLLALDSALGRDVAGDIVRGGRDAVAEAGAAVMGGHSIDDDEPKYGLAVFGSVSEGSLVRNAGAKAGDALYLTKPLGTGLLSAGHTAGAADDRAFSRAVESMKELNAAGAAAMAAAGAHAATDVTGFGLAGHLHEMLSASGVSARLSWNAIPTFPQAKELARQWCRPARSFSIEDYASGFLELEPGLAAADRDAAIGVLCDPQTSGGLLAAVPPQATQAFERAFERETGRAPRRIGEIRDGDAGHIYVAI